MAGVSRSGIVAGERGKPRSVDGTRWDSSRASAPCLCPTCRGSSYQHGSAWPGGRSCCRPLRGSSGPRVAGGPTPAAWAIRQARPPLGVSANLRHECCCQQMANARVHQGGRRDGAGPGRKQQGACLHSRGRDRVLPAGGGGTAAPHRDQRLVRGHLAPTPSAPATPPSATAALTRAASGTRTPRPQMQLSPFFSSSRRSGSEPSLPHAPAADAPQRPGDAAPYVAPGVFRPQSVSPHRAVPLRTPEAPSPKRQQFPHFSLAGNSLYELPALRERDAETAGLCLLHRRAIAVGVTGFGRRPKAQNGLQQG